MIATSRSNRSPTRSAMAYASISLAFMADHTPEDPNDRNAAITFVGSCCCWSITPTCSAATCRICDRAERGREPAWRAAHDDILSLLEEKTRGKPLAGGAPVLEQILFDLRMRYVEIDKSGTAEHQPQQSSFRERPDRGLEKPVNSSKPDCPA